MGHPCGDAFMGSKASFSHLLTFMYWLFRAVNAPSSRTKYYIPDVMAYWPNFLLRHRIWKLLYCDSLISFIYLIGRQHCIVVKSENMVFESQLLQCDLIQSGYSSSLRQFSHLQNGENCLGTGYCRYFSLENSHLLCGPL